MATDKQSAANAMGDCRALEAGFMAIRDGIQAAQTAARALKHDALGCAEIDPATDATLQMLSHLWGELIWLYGQSETIKRNANEAYRTAELAEQAALAKQEAAAGKTPEDAGGGTDGKKTGGGEAPTT